jgi:hypothetical protein
MKRAAVVVTLQLVAAFSMGIVATVNAGEPFSGPVQQMEGQIKAFAFQMSGEQHPRVVLIEVTDVRQPLATP